MAALTILTTEIRQLDGLYSLNDIHKAAGGESKHQPAFFLRTDQTRALIEEISSANMQSLVTVEGKAPTSAVNWSLPTPPGSAQRST